MRRMHVLGLVLLTSLLFAPSVASAQSQFTGQVRDESGAILPGVTVEAASPVLIEKAKTAVTDDQGRYSIVDLRPGTYKITFTLTGFSTILREGVELPSNFVATINADMKVGTLEETVTVSGQTPLVDVTQAARTQVVTRDMLDTLPTTRHIFSVSNMLPGIRFATPDIGGSRQMEQTNPRGHGVNGAQAQEAIDGMSTSSQESNIVWTYVNDSLIQEVSVTTAAHPAEVQGAAMRMNMIPKDGGNTFSGSVFLGGSDGNWQASNIDDYLRSQNITRGNGIAHVQTFNGSLGGPVKRDRLWFFVTARHASTDEVVANVGETITTPQGEQLKSTIDQYIRDALGRLTWQINQKNKFAVFFNRTWKRKGKDFGAGSDPRAGSYRDPRTGKYAVGQAKYTNTLTRRWLLEAGYSSPINHITIDNEPNISLPRYLANGEFNPAWLANARRTDTANNINPRCALSIGCRAWVSNGQDQRTIATGHRTVASASYVTGTHNVKFGIDRSFGWARVYTERQADLVQNYQNNRATNVTVYSTPGARNVYVNYDLGYFAQDAWTIKRLTLNVGLRVDNFQSMYEETANPPGRFVPARFFPERRKLPNWNNDLAPRLSAAYDLFGNGRTAIKGSWSKYYERLTGGFADRYAPGVQNETRNWFDCALNAAGTACSGVVLPTNGDDIAQEHEIGPSGTTNFGLTGTDRDMDPNLQRLGNREITITGSHQVTSRISVTAGWYHRTYQDLQQLDRTLITTADYTSFTIPTPDVSRDATLDGVIPSGPLTVYNLNPAKRSVFNSASSRQERRRSVDLQRLRSLVQRTAPGRQHAVRQLDDGAKRVGVLFDRRQSERSADRGPLHGGVGGQRRPLLRSGAVRHAVRARVQTGGQLSRAVCRTRCQRRRAELCGARAHHHISAGGKSVPERAHEHRNDHPERAWLSVLPSLQSARSEFQEELQDRIEDIQRANRLLQRAERKRDLCAPGRSRQLTRRRDDDPPRTTDAAGVSNEVLTESSVDRPRHSQGGVHPVT